MKSKQKNLEGSLVVDKDGVKYVGVETIQLYFNESRPTAYRRIADNFKDEKAPFHSSFVESIIIPGQRATKSGITLEGFLYYINALESAKHSDNEIIREIQYTKDELMKNGSISQDSLLARINFMNEYDGQVIAELKAKVANSAIIKITNPFEKNSFTFVEGDTYEEFIEWSKKGNKVGKLKKESANEKD